MSPCNHYLRRITINGDHSISASALFDTFDWFELKEQQIEPPFIPITNVIDEKLHINEGYSKFPEQYSGDQEIFKDFGVV